jgi:hypothetical protein
MIPIGAAFLNVTGRKDLVLSPSIATTPDSRSAAINQWEDMVCDGWTPCYVIGRVSILAYAADL